MIKAWNFGKYEIIAINNMKFLLFGRKPITYVITLNILLMRLLIELQMCLHCRKWVAKYMYSLNELQNFFYFDMVYNHIV